MSFGVVFDVHGPVELYDAIHAEFAKYRPDGLLVHVARPVDGGVQVLEVWTSPEAFETFMGAHGGAVMEAVAAAGWAVPEVAPQPFDPRGLIVPSAAVNV